jgi:hypothetical protein
MSNPVWPAYEVISENCYMVVLLFCCRLGSMSNANERSEWDGRDSIGPLGEAVMLLLRWVVLTGVQPFIALCSLLLEVPKLCLMR